MGGKIWKQEPTGDDAGDGVQSGCCFALNIFMPETMFSHNHQADAYIHMQFILFVIGCKKTIVETWWKHVICTGKLKCENVIIIEEFIMAPHL